MLLQASYAKVTNITGRSGSLCRLSSDDEEVWEEVTGIFKAVMSAKERMWEGSGGGFMLGGLLKVFPFDPQLKLQGNYRFSSCPANNLFFDRILLSLNFRTFTFLKMFSSK